MREQALNVTIIEAWQRLVHYIAGGHAGEFTGQKKETAMLRQLRREIERAQPSLRIVGPDMQERFNNWSIDLVCALEPERIAVEGKFKTLSDGATPDNRYEAFRDLFIIGMRLFAISSSWNSTCTAAITRRECSFG
jgi:hypothetical protein